MFEVCVSTRFCLNVGVGKVKERKKETQRESSEFILLSVCVLILFFFLAFPSLHVFLLKVTEE